MIEWYPHGSKMHSDHCRRASRALGGDPRISVQRPNRQRNIGNAYALYKNSTSDIEVSSPFYMSLKLL